MSLTSQDVAVSGSASTLIDTTITFTCTAGTGTMTYGSIKTGSSMVISFTTSGPTVSLNAEENDDTKDKLDITDQKMTMASNGDYTFNANGISFTLTKAQVEAATGTSKY